MNIEPKHITGTFTITKEELEHPKYTTFEIMEFQAVNNTVYLVHDLNRQMFLTPQKARPIISIEKIREWKRNGFRYASKKRQIKKNGKNWNKHLMRSL